VCTLQDKQLQHQLQTLQAKLQGLTGEDRGATEEELAECTQLLPCLYNATSQSASMLQAQSARPQATVAVAANGASRLPHVQAHAHSNSSHLAAPLLLGLPS